MIRYIKADTVDWNSSKSVMPEDHRDWREILRTIPKGKAAVVPLNGQPDLRVRNKVHGVAKSMGFYARVRLVSETEIAILLY